MWVQWGRVQDCWFVNVGWIIVDDNFLLNFDQHTVSGVPTIACERKLLGTACWRRSALGELTDFRRIKHRLILLTPVGFFLCLLLFKLFSRIVLGSCWYAHLSDARKAALWIVAEKFALSFSIYTDERSSAEESVDAQSLAASRWIRFGNCYYAQELHKAESCRTNWVSYHCELFGSLLSMIAWSAFSAALDGGAVNSSFLKRQPGWSFSWNALSEGE